MCVRASVCVCKCVCVCVCLQACVCAYACVEMLCSNLYEFLSGSQLIAVSGVLTVRIHELMVSLFIRCTMRCEIWAQPAELPR